MTGTGALRALIRHRAAGITRRDAARKAAFEAAHPGSAITYDTGIGVWKGHVTVGDCEVFKVRYDYGGDLERGGGLPRLLDDLDAALREDPSG